MEQSELVQIEQYATVYFNGEGQQQLFSMGKLEEYSTILNIEKAKFIFNNSINPYLLLFTAKTLYKRITDSISSVQILMIQDLGFDLICM
jgi:hypothetical protein